MSKKNTGANFEPIFWSIYEQFQSFRSNPEKEGDDQELNLYVYEPDRYETEFTVTRKWSTYTSVTEVFAYKENQNLLLIVKKNVSGTDGYKAEQKEYRLDLDLDFVHEVKFKRKFDGFKVQINGVKFEV